MTFEWASDPSAALGLVERIAAVGVLLASLELLARRDTLRADGLLSWEVARLRTAWLAVGTTGAVLDRLLAPPGVYVLCWVRLLAAAVVIVAPTANGASVAALLIVAVIGLLLMLRTSYGNDGADQMLLLVLLSSASVRVIGSEDAYEYALWFIALQCLLAYLTSGMGKLAGRSWRDGSGLVGVLTTRTYGMRSAAAALERHPWIAVLLSWAIILTEIAFPLVLIAPDPWVAVMLAGGMAFHVTSAIVMGLNAFVWAFVATYPAIAFVAW